MGKVLLVPTLNSQIKENSAWCVSFDLAWKEFQEEVLKKKFRYNGNEEIVKDLIEECKEEIQINPDDYYVASGQQTIKLKKKIEKTLKKKFDTTSDILDNIDFVKDKHTPNILVYAILMFVTKFACKFDIYPEKIPFGKNKTLAEYFGIFISENRRDLTKQVDALFYNSENDFALELEGQNNKKIVLYRTDAKDSFDTVWNRLIENANARKSDITVGDVMVPNINLDLMQNFEGLEGQEFVRESDHELFAITQAIQTLKFELNNEGAKVKSEAIINAIKGCAPRPVVKKDFLFNDTFYLFVTDGNTPVVALRVEDIGLFVINPFLISCI